MIIWDRFDWIKQNKIGPAMLKATQMLAWHVFGASATTSCHYKATIRFGANPWKPGQNQKRTGLIKNHLEYENKKHTYDIWKKKKKKEHPIIYSNIFWCVLSFNHFGCFPNL